MNRQVDNIVQVFNNGVSRAAASQIPQNQGMFYVELNQDNKHYYFSLWEGTVKIEQDIKNSVRYWQEEDANILKQYIQNCYDMFKGLVPEQKFELVVQYYTNVF